MSTVLSHQVFLVLLGLGTARLNEQAETDCPAEKRFVSVLPDCDVKLHAFKIGTVSC